MKSPRISPSLQHGVVGGTVVSGGAGHHRDGVAQVAEELVDHRKMYGHAGGVEGIGGPLPIEVPSAAKELTAEREHTDVRRGPRCRDGGEGDLGFADDRQPWSGANTSNDPFARGEGFP